MDNRIIDNFLIMTEKLAELNFYNAQKSAIEELNKAAILAEELGIFKVAESLTQLSEEIATKKSS